MKVLRERYKDRKEDVIGGMNRDLSMIRRDLNKYLITDRIVYRLARKRLTEDPESVRSLTEHEPVERELEDIERVCDEYAMICRSYPSASQFVDGERLVFEMEERLHGIERDLLEVNRFHEQVEQQLTNNTPFRLNSWMSSSEGGFVWRMVGLSAFGMLLISPFTGWEIRILTGGLVVLTLLPGALGNLVVRTVNPDELMSVEMPNRFVFEENWERFVKLWDKRVGEE